MNYTTNPTQRKMSIPKDIICFPAQKISKLYMDLAPLKTSNMSYGLRNKERSTYVSPTEKVLMNS